MMNLTSSIYLDIKDETKRKEIITIETSLPNINESSNENEQQLGEEIVYDNMTLQQLADKLEKSMYDDLSGYGYYFANYSLEIGVDPYLALAIVSEETGCKFGCSNLVKFCHNIGGMKGMGCGSYSYFNSFEESIKAFLDNLKKNYYDYGLTTAELMNPKYAESPLWASNVNAYIELIKNA